MSSLASNDLVLCRSFLRMCRKHWHKQKVADSTGQRMTGGQLLTRALVFRRLLLRVLAADEKYVGVLLPPTAGGMLANAALSLMGRAAVNLNYTASSEILNACMRQCEARHIVTSKLFMHRMKHLKLDAKLIYLEELVKGVRRSDKLIGAAMAYAMPLPVLDRVLGIHKLSRDDVATIIFTSGSTGEPKGVMLSWGNIASNVHGIDRMVWLKDDDMLVGILPFFHSFGYTCTMWTVLCLSLSGVYHTSPLEAREMAKLCAEHRGTILMTTPTFLRSYLKRCEPEELKTLELVIAGAEKLPRDLSHLFQERFGAKPIEGYGTTELSPLTSVNIPAERSRPDYVQGEREGSVGRPIPQVEAKIVDPESGHPLPANQEGMLWIKGPNVMLGYLNRPDMTAKVIRDGWYETGDIGRIDEDGFIYITSRLSRFSKLGGEMVPHIQIEEALERALGIDESDLRIAVTAIPDARKGERLVVLYTNIDKTPDQLCDALSAAGLPNLYIPSTDSFRQVDAIPVLGTGKLDLRNLKQKALDLFAVSAVAKKE